MRLLDIAHLGELPDVSWKVMTIAQLPNSNPKKIAAYADELELLLAANK